jgi:hypothetical protein
VIVALIVIALLTAVVLFVGAPLRHGVAEEAEADEVGQLAELELEKEAKYREIRDAELDRQTGKLSQADWIAIDRELRAEAIAILHRIDRLGPGTRAQPRVRT